MSLVSVFFFFFFKQKTAYEMRISDWSSDVCSSDLFIKTAKEKDSVPAEFDVPFAHTPAFVGSHITGYDNAMKGILEHFWDGKAKTVDKLVRVDRKSVV